MKYRANAGLPDSYFIISCRIGTIFFCLYMGTDGKGVWSHLIIEMTGIMKYKKGISFSIAQIPFQRSNHLLLLTKEQKNATIKLMDVLGQSKTINVTGKQFNNRKRRNESRIYFVQEYLIRKNILK